jgi:hypothetical protein
MSFTVEDFPDLMRVLKEHPDWRDDLRRQVLADELLALPSQVAEFRATTERRFQELAAAQARTEAKVTELAAAQARTEARLETLAQAQAQTEAKVTVLVNAQAVMTEQIVSLTQAVQLLTDGVGELKGVTTEIEYRSKAHAYFSRVLRRPRMLSSNEIAELLDDAVEAGTLSETEAHDIALADIILRGKQRTDGREAYLLVEISWGVGPYDVERAARRAELLTHLGVPVIPAVAGRRLTAEAAELARARQVWQILDGATLTPSP